MFDNTRVNGEKKGGKKGMYNIYKQQYICIKGKKSSIKKKKISIFFPTLFLSHYSGILKHRISTGSSSAEVWWLVRGQK